jgi:3-deoxy-D-manno-octulosonate 8-phosphate phosphatase (KDO 8-P phosphatase)
VKDKLALAKELCAKLGIELSEVAFIGDDLNDMHLLAAVGLSACPSSAPDYVKERVHWKMEKRGGEGVFREFVETYLRENNLLDGALQAYLDGREKFVQ